MTWRALIAWPYAKAKWRRMVALPAESGLPEWMKKEVVRLEQLYRMLTDNKPLPGGGSGDSDEEEEEEEEVADSEAEDEEDAMDEDGGGCGNGVDAPAEVEEAEVTHTWMLKRLRSAPGVIRAGWGSGA